MREKISYLKRSSNLCFFIKPSFLEGMARVLDVGGTLQTESLITSPMQTDIEAISRDWKTVGEDIKHSIYEWKQTANA